MKRIVLFLLVIVSITAKAQVSDVFFGNRPWNVNAAYKLAVLNSTDSIMSLDSNSTRFIRPIWLKSYTISGGYPLAPRAGQVIYDSDTGALRLSNGTTWATIGGSGGGGSQTLQQVITTGATLTTANSITMGGNAMTWSGAYSIFDSAKVGGRLIVGSTIRPSHVLDVFGRTFITSDSIQQIQRTSATNVDVGWAVSNSSGTNRMALYYNEASGIGTIGMLTSGGYLLRFMSNGAELMRGSSSANLLINSTTDNGTGKVQITNNGGAQAAWHFDAARYAGPTVNSNGGLNIKSVANRVGINVASPAYGFQTSGTLAHNKDSLPIVASITNEYVQVIDTTTGQIKRITAANLGATNIYNSDGTLSGVRALSGGGNNLSIGTSGSRVGSLFLYANTVIQAQGAWQWGSATSGDNDYTFSSTVSLVFLSEITANRTLTFPSQGSGKMIYIHNQNSSGGNAWNVSGTVEDAAGNAIGTLINDTFYIFISNGSAWVKAN